MRIIVVPLVKIAPALKVELDRRQDVVVARLEEFHLPLPHLPPLLDQSQVVLELTSTRNAAIAPRKPENAENGVRDDGISFTLPAPLNPRITSPETCRHQSSTGRPSIEMIVKMEASIHVMLMIQKRGGVYARC